MKWVKLQLNNRPREFVEGKKSPGRIGGILGPGKRWGHTCNSVKGGRLLYVFGGYGKENCQTNDVHVFDTVKQTWSKPMMKGFPPSPRDSHSCTTVGSSLFVFGGTDGKNPLNDLHILDTSTNTWISPKVIGDGPAAREGHSATLVDKRLFIFGGCGKSLDDHEEVYYNDLHILDTEMLTWKRAWTCGNPPCARDSHTSSSWNNKIVVLGGEDASDYYLSDVHILDTDTLVWKELNTTGQVLTSRAGHSSVALGKHVFVFGGFTDDRSLYDDLHVLNIETCEWSKVTDAGQGPSARFSVAGDCLDPRNGILVFIGGCNKNLEALDDMYYLYTDMRLENGHHVQKSEKLSLRKELKKKCQEQTLLAHRLEKVKDETVLEPSSNPFKPVLLPHSGQPSCQIVSPFSNSNTEVTFEAKVTNIFDYGYSIETVIHGKLLRGIIFSRPEKAVVASRKRVAVDDGVIKLNDGNYSRIEVDGHYENSKFQHGTQSPEASKTDGTDDSYKSIAERHLEEDSPGSDEVVSSPNNEMIQ